MTPHIDPYEAGTAPTGDLFTDLGLDTLGHLSTVPADEPWQRTIRTELGALRIERWIPTVGLLVFESADVGQWLTKKGEPAKKAKRTYALTPLNGETREMDAVSSIVGCLDKYALRGWYEDHGARGGAKAQALGELEDVPEEEIISRVRALGFGAQDALSDAQGRGSATHSVFENLALDQPVPSRDLFPAEWLPWYDGAARAWEAMDPVADDVEQIVCHPEDGYAGRPDIVATLGETPQMVMRGWAGKRALLDYKTGKGKIFREAHFQTRLYERARRRCGFDPVDLIVIVGVTDEGGYLFNESVVDDAGAEDLLRTYRRLGLVDKAIAQVRREAKAA